MTYLSWGDIATVYGIMTAILGLLTALMSIIHPSEPSFLCPNPSNLNPALLEISTQSILPLSAVYLGAAIRLTAFAQLGKDFNFRLATPSHLVTNGLYGYVQHPSYLGQAVIWLGLTPFLIRGDGVLGCVIPTGVASSIGMSVWVNTLLWMGIRAYGSFYRIRDEEAMLRDAYGTEWVSWHEKTARLIPGVL